MADYEREKPRGRGGFGNGGGNRKRRYRDEEEYDHRPQRRRYEEPLSSKLRKQFLSLAESPLKRVEDEILSIAKLVSESFSTDSEVRDVFLDLVGRICVEQPFKIPFVAAVVVVLNTLGEEGGKVVGEVVKEISGRVKRGVNRGEWREVKGLCKFLGGVQGVLEGEGVWAFLQDLLGKAVDLQTDNNEEMVGPELVKIILFTIPYIMASSATDQQDKAAAMIENADIIASEPHVLQALVDPYPGNGKEEALSPTGVLGLLQKQLQNESASGWELACLPRPWKFALESPDELTTAPKHALPAIVIPEVINAGPRPLFPELYFSVYADQDIETVPPTDNIASCLLRDALVDTINILDYNRNATARFLIDIDCYFAPGTFVKRATPFDRLRDIEGDKSTWKPEDVAVDAVFSQLFQLPTPEHKLVYYHSVLTESCKIAPAAIAPSLGRAIRYLYRSVDSMDLELSYRFMDWFSHHLSNFGFTWKWTEWIDDVELPSLDPKKAFIIGALDKEIRLSFAQRIKGTLPAPYQQLITKEKEKDTPDFKFNDEETPFAKEGQTLLTLLKTKAPELQIQPILETIHTLASSLSLDPLTSSTDAYVTCICYIGSKSLSHVLSCIERCKERLLAIGSSSEKARKQIIESVMEYWKDQPGIGVNIVDKLLNYTILSPGSVVEWALGGEGRRLGEAHVFEMVGATIGKVTGRVRQVVRASHVPGLLSEQKTLLVETAERERASMKDLFANMETLLVGWTKGDGEGEEQKMIRQWAERWLRVFRRKTVVEDAWFVESGKIVVAPEDEKVDDVKMDGEVGAVDGGVENGAVDGRLGEEDGMGIE